MGDFDMWGAEASGSRLAHLDQLKTRGMDLDAAKDLLEIGMAPDKAALIRAQARKAAAEASKDEAAATRSQQLARQLQGLEGNDEPLAMEDKLDAIANMHFNAGEFNTGSQIAQRASGIRTNNARQLSSTALAEQRAQQNQLRDLELANGIYREVKSPEEWEAAHDKFELLANKPSPFLGLEYNPELPGNLSKAMLSERDKISLDLNKRRTDAAEKNAKSAEAQRNTNMERIRAVTNLVKERLSVLKKNGGSDDPEAKQLTRTLRELQIAAAKDRLKGRSAQTPLEVVPPVAQRQAGAFYKTPQGVLRWHPNGWVREGVAMPALPEPRGFMDTVRSTLSGLSGDDEDLEDDDGEE